MPNGTGRRHRYCGRVNVYHARWHVIRTYYMQPPKAPGVLLYMQLCILNIHSCMYTLLLNMKGGDKHGANKDQKCGMY